MNLRRTCAAVAALVACSLMSAGSAQAIVGGQPDTNRHPYVGLVATSVGYCTGSAISPTVVVTAAHCVEPGAPVEFYYDLDGSGSPTGREGLDGVIQGTPHRYPGYSPPASNSGGLPAYAVPDLAVIVLAAPLPFTQFAQLPAPNAVSVLPHNPAVTYVGYGVQGFTTGGGPAQSIFDETFVRQTADGQIISSNSTFSENFVRLTSRQQVRLCFGDSGSPILSGNTVLAVLSWGVGGKCAGQINAFRIDTPDTLAFIRSFLS